MRFPGGTRAVKFTRDASCTLRLLRGKPKTVGASESARARRFARRIRPVRALFLVVHEWDGVYRAPLTA